MHGVAYPFANKVAAPVLCIQLSPSGKRLPGLKAACADFVRRYISHVPRGRDEISKIPHVTLEPVLQDCGGFRRPPDAIGLCKAVEIHPKKRIKPCHVIHVEVGEKQVVYRLNVSPGKGVETV